MPVVEFSKGLNQLQSGQVIEWVVCSTPHALSPDSLSPDGLSPRALSPRAHSPRAHSPRALSPHALSPNGLRNTWKNQALQVDFFFRNLSRIVFLTSYIKETGLSS